MDTLGNKENKSFWTFRETFQLFIMGIESSHQKESILQVNIPIKKSVFGKSKQIFPRKFPIFSNKTTYLEVLIVSPYIAAS